jgi:23S rRNA-/tRNA-specific pseudouridylate synthase
MAGLRGQDEIEKAFADLEYLPGSKKKKRREEDPKVSRRKAGETNGWDEKPIMKTLGGKEAKLSYRLIKSSDNYHLLEVHLETGRHHQIRAQLSTIGCTIKGDLKYGAKRSNPDGSICLHARELSFNHPTTKDPVTIIAPVPNEPIWQFFEQ